MRYIKLFEDYEVNSVDSTVRMIFSEFTDLDGELHLDIIDNRIYLGLVAKDTTNGFDSNEREVILDGFNRMEGFCEQNGYNLITDGVDGSYVELVKEEEMCPKCGSIEFSTDYKYERGRTNYECNDCGETGDQDDFVNRHLDITDDRSVESLISMGLISICVNYSK
jgi:tRNA(Ile2) C34 agmatinyltransferase TiaS